MSALELGIKEYDERHGEMCHQLREAEDKIAQKDDHIEELTADVEALKVERDALRNELCSVLRQWSDDYLDFVGYPVDMTELSALAQAVWTAPRP